MDMIESYHAVALVLLVVGCDSCSIDCGEDMLCTDNLYGYLMSDCTGFLGCINKTEPCAGVCPPGAPVLSSDGLTCTACTEDGVCPDCGEGEVWCGEEGICKSNSAMCGGKCGSILRPVLDQIDKECYPCSESDRWCEEDGRCFDPTREPCNQECQQWGTRYCNETQLCLENDIPCQSFEVEEKQQLFKDLCKDKGPTVVKTHDGKSYVFTGEWYHQEGIPGAIKISEGWPGLPDNIDAALTWDRQNDTYFFKADKYWRFLGQTPSPGYPKILSNWSGLPSNMEAAREWGKNEQFTHFFKSSNYLTIKEDTEGFVITQPRGDLDTGHWWFGCNHTIGDVWMPTALIGV